MSAATVFIFAPVDEARDSHKRLEAEGCELRLGKASWDTPQGNSEPELIRMDVPMRAWVPCAMRISSGSLSPCGVSHAFPRRSSHPSASSLL